MEKSTITMKKDSHSWSVYSTCIFLIFVTFLSFSTLLFTNNVIPLFTTQTLHSIGHDSCRDRYIYIHDLPPKFNRDILRSCKSLNPWTNMCPSTQNQGLGPGVNSPRGPRWFATNHFLVEVIFHNRMKRYECLTNKSSMASLIYVPYYAGLDVGRHLWDDNTTARDELSLELVQWLAEKPEWRTMSGHDHFLPVGRIVWDFSRQPMDLGGWGNQLLALNQTKNMTILIHEAARDSEAIGIPYPSYFHPSNETEVFRWQDTVRSLERKFLYSFVGGPDYREDPSIHGHIIRQCMTSNTTCKYLNSDYENMVEVMETFESSTFCLQPPGNSRTRRSTFDSILAGCIPAFFNETSAYLQYVWHLPDNYTSYSVFIPEDDIKEGKDNIEQVLSRIPDEEVAALKEEVVKLIPKVTYAVNKFETIEDAFDIAIRELLDNANDMRELF